MTPTLNLPKNFREQVIERLRDAPDGDLLVVHEALRHADKLRLLDTISDGAECEQKAGQWENLQEMIEEVRDRLRRT